MKKIVSVLCMVGIVSALLAGCGSKLNISDEAMSIGEKVIEITDEYLDKDIAGDDAKDQIDTLYDELDEYVDSEDGSDTETADGTICTYIMCISTSMLLDYYDNTEETYDNLLEDRNNLAKKLGLDER